MAKETMKTFEKTVYAWTFHNPEKPVNTTIRCTRVSDGYYHLKTLVIGSRLGQPPRMAVSLRNIETDDGVWGHDQDAVKARLKKVLDNLQYDRAHFGDFYLCNGEQFQYGAIRRAREMFKALGIKDDGDHLLAEFSSTRKTIVKPEANGRLVTYDDVLKRSLGLTPRDNYIERMDWDRYILMTEDEWFR